MTKTQSRTTPKLRFRGFSKEWEEINFGSVYSFLKTNSLSRSEMSDSGDIKNIHYGDIHMRLATNFDSSKETIGFIAENNVSDFCKEGDLVIADASEDRQDVGKTIEIIKTNGDKIVAGLHTFLTRPKETSIVAGFSGYLMQSKYVRKQIMRIATGASVLGISKKELSKIIIWLPEIEEQKKIAGFLGLIDDKISGLEKKKELLEKYKKGVMQKIFTQQIRFKGFSSKWEETLLSEAGKTYNGLQGKTAEDFGEGQPYITYSQIFADSTLNITSFGKVNVLANEKQNVAKKGDVFFTTSSETPEEVGYSSVLLDDVEPLYLNSFCFGYRINDQKKLLPEFAQFLFRSQGFRKKVVRLAQGSTRYNLSKIELMKTVVELPELEEQKVIADFLTAIDDKIELTKRELEQAKNWKKGLLQQMFV